MDAEERYARITEVLGVTPKGMAWLDQETARRRDEVSVLHDTSVALSIIGDSVGRAVGQEGYIEAARRLTHALAEIAAILDTNYPSPSNADVAQASLKAKDTLREWGVV